jgi:hypothetical protein|tara:strand:+ start:3497 stop:3715 length:219 start_codon:yes stop_codon:yes gene_type:complete
MENLKKNIYKIIENGEHINTLDATNRIMDLTNDYLTKQTIVLIDNILDTYILDHISVKALESKRDELINLNK